MAHFGPYRSYCSADSVASSKHISLGLHKSGDSQATVDSDDVSKWVENFVKSNPVRETDAEKAMSALDATRDMTMASLVERNTFFDFKEVSLDPRRTGSSSTEAGIASCPGRIDFRTDAMPMSTDADELAAFAEKYVQKNPVQDMPSALETLEVTTATESASTLEAPLAFGAATVDVTPCQHMSFSPAVLAQCHPTVVIVQPVPVPVFFPVSTTPPATRLPNSSQASRRNRSRSTVPTRGPRIRNSIAKALPGSEEEWIERIRKRTHGLNELKARDCYRNNQDISRSQRPPSLNPNDRTTPKRKWEESLAECRIGWRRIDGVRKLTSMGFSEMQATAAWNTEPATMDTETALLILRVWQLMDMGFHNEHANKIALQRASGNVNEAVQILISSQIGGWPGIRVL